MSKHLSITSKICLGLALFLVSAVLVQAANYITFDATKPSFILDNNVQINGNVGIGTPTPNRQLHIKTTSGNAELDIQSASSPYWAIYQDDGSDALRFWNTNDRLTITTGGDVTVTGTINAGGGITATGTITASGGNSGNWNTAYADRFKWDGGSSGLTASTGRTSLGLSTASTQIQDLTGTYGSINISGSAGGYSGINFPAVTGRGGRLMVHNTLDYQGFYSETAGAWSWYFQNGALTVGTVPWANVTGAPPIPTVIVGSLTQGTGIEITGTTITNKGDTSADDWQGHSISSASVTGALTVNKLSLKSVQKSAWQVKATISCEIKFANNTKIDNSYANSPAVAVCSTGTGTLTGGGCHWSEVQKEGNDDVYSVPGTLNNPTAIDSAVTVDSYRYSCRTSQNNPVTAYAVCCKVIP